jgi:hypothetical protein
MGKDSTARLVSDLLEKIVSDDPYKAVQDEEAALVIPGKSPILASLPRPPFSTFG